MRLPGLIIILSGFLIFPGLLAAQQRADIPYSTDTIGGDDASAGKAIANPDRYAWELFGELNQPSNEEDGTVIWENWGLARLVYDNPDISQEDLLMKWKDGTLRPASSSRTERFESLPIQQRILRNAKEKATGHALTRRKLSSPPIAGFDPVLASDTPPENDEVRMNYSAFKTVVEHDVYSIDGQEAAFSSGKQFSFEPDAKEIKAEWRNISNLPANTQSTFHTAKFPGEGKPDEVWGLIALHITTKDLPNWFWATWEHSSNAQRESVAPSRDRWGVKLKVGDHEFDVQDLLNGNEKGDPYPDGQPTGPSTELLAMFAQKGLNPDKWKHYLLRGTQVDFTDKFGRPTILANSVIEEGFQNTSSCITCHSKAGIGPRLRRSDEKNMLQVFASTDPPVGDIGVPNPEWFHGTSIPPSRNYLQFDFVWSTIRAKRKGSKKNGDEINPLIGRWSYGAIKDLGPEVLGDGVLTIKSVDESKGSFEGGMAINMGSNTVWNLDIAGAIKRESGRWSIKSFVGSGSDEQNNPTSGNFWSYRYEDVDSESDQKIRGRVVRTLTHLSSNAYRLKESGRTIEDIVEELGREHTFNEKGVSGTFRLVKLKN